MSADLTSAAWYLARGSGITTLVLFSIVMALGIATRSGRPLPGLPRFVVQGVHRSASLLAVTFLGVHIATLLVDPYAQLKLLDIVVPFTGAYRGFWLGLGTLSLDLFLALVVTSLLRARIGAKVWRALHWAAYAAWPVAVAHGLGTGTDASTSWMLAITGACVALVGGSLLWRMSPSFTRSGPTATLKNAPSPAVTSARIKELAR